MKIFQIIPSLDLGGAETMCVGLSELLHRQGQEVTVVSMYRKETMLTARLKQAGIRVVFLDKKTGLDLSSITKLRTLFRREKPDAIHVHLFLMKYVVPAALGLGIPVIHTVHSVASYDAEGDRAVNRFFYNRGLAVPVAISKEIAKTVEEFYSVPAEKIRVVFNGIDLQKCLPKEDYSLQNPPYLVHVGRFFEAKNHEVMVRAVKLLKERGMEVRLDFCGDGETRGAAEALVRALGVEENVRFCGVAEQVFPILHEADLFLLPSRFEGMPMSLIEAMGTGLPAIASRVGGISDMVTDGHNGLLIEPNAEELANAIARLLDAPELRERLGRNAREEAVRFSGETMARNYMKLYQNA